MKDSELCGVVLKFLYDRRKQGKLVFGGQSSTPIPESIDLVDWLRACGYLADQGVAEWNPLQDHTGRGLLACAIKINFYGVRAVEGDEEMPSGIVIDQRQYVQVTSSQGVQIAGAHSQQNQTITDAFEKVINAIDGAAVSEAEKEKARSLLAKLLKSPAIGAIAGAGTAALIKLLGG